MIHGSTLFEIPSNGMCYTILNIPFSTFSLSLWLFQTSVNLKTKALSLSHLWSPTRLRNRTSRPRRPERGPFSSYSRHHFRPILRNPTRTPLEICVWTWLSVFVVVVVVGFGFVCSFVVAVAQRHLERVTGTNNNSQQRSTLRETSPQLVENTRLVHRSWLRFFRCHSRYSVRSHLCPHHK